MFDTKIVLVVLGARRLRSLGSDLGTSIKDFKGVGDRRRDTIRAVHAGPFVLVQP
jgi:Sec-independent protein translocase protein TatA